MRILEWNVGHQTRRKPIPGLAALALTGLDSDVVVLTEYVADESHRSFLLALSDAGLAHVKTSPYVAGQNQVLIASRWTCNVMNSSPPPLSRATTPNWLHLRMPGPGFDLIGLRVPMFEVPSVRKDYWNWFECAVLAMRGQPTVLIGDLNADPGQARRVGGVHLGRLSEKGWCIATPTMGWSFVGKTGRTSRIDHAILSRHFRTDAPPQYITEWNGFTFAGSREYSDHAVLCIDISRAS